MKNAKTCDGCYWQDQCNSSWRCSDYTPMVEEPDITYYEDDLKDRAAEYQKVVRDFNE